MRVFTCTPVAFGGGEDFFARDSGLLCRGLQSMGIESMAVMPGDSMPGDGADLIRTEYRNLEDPGWWRSQSLDGVVLYAWGAPKYRKVAGAIREAGIHLILNQDSGGAVSPLAGFREWLGDLWNHSGQGITVSAKLGFVFRVLRGLTLGLFLVDPLRAAHLRHGSRIACVSPGAADLYRKLCRRYGGERLAAKVCLIPHSVEPAFHYDGREKRRQVACVGRWADTIQKRPEMLASVMDKLLREMEDVSVVVAGEPDPTLVSWRSALPPALADRVYLRGRVGRAELASILSESMVFYSPSAFESFGIAAAEALCSGCSVVASRSVSLPSFEWFTSEGSGLLSDGDDPSGHLQALSTELGNWLQGRRNPGHISRIWCARLHSHRIAAQVMDFLHKDARSGK